MHIASGALSARANVVLSPELTAQAGVDLRRYAQEDGRVVVPATIGGTLQQPTVSLDVAAAARRALTNELERRTQLAARRAVQEEEVDDTIYALRCCDGVRFSGPTGGCSAAPR